MNKKATRQRRPVSHGLEIGKRLRDIRRDRDWTLEELSKHTGIAPSTISKLENGQGVINIDTLMKLSKGLGLSLDSLANPATRPSNSGVRTITRRGTGETYGTGVSEFEVLSKELAHKRIFPVVIRTAREDDSPGGSWNEFPGERFLYVLRGSIKLLTEYYTPVVLDEGDSAHFDSSMRHGVVSADGSEAEFLSISYDGTGQYVSPPELSSAEVKQLKTAKRIAKTVDEA